MFGIEITLLTGRYTATSFSDRNVAEWPPHPARLFSAMVAGWAENGEDADERQALEWLEALPPPAITFSEAARRRPVTHFVPVNDAGVVSPSMYEKRAERIEEILEDIERALESSAGREDRAVERLHAQLVKQRDVDQQVQAVGNTPPSAAVELLPERRGRQARVFPSVTPAEPVFTFAWEDQPTARVGEALASLLTRVTRLGHSSSLVFCRTTIDPPPATLVPGAGTESLRWVAQGQLAALEELFLGHRGCKPRVLPYTEVRYGSPGVSTAAPIKSNLSGRWIAFEFTDSHRRLRPTSIPVLTKAFRNALFSHAEDPIPEGLSGHTQSGAPSGRPHVAVLGLPYVGHEYADGGVKGVAVLIPYEVDEEARVATLRAIGAWRTGDNGDWVVQLNLGRLGSIRLHQVVGEPETRSVSQDRWSGMLHGRRRELSPSKTWISATPIALPTHPGQLREGTPHALDRAWRKAEEAVAASCIHVGLPEPVDVSVSLTPFLRGSVAADSFPAFIQNGRGGRPVARRLVHAAVRFTEPVEGPLVLGAGRFLGLGLMVPVSDTSEPTDE